MKLLVSARMNNIRFITFLKLISNDYCMSIMLILFFPSTWSVWHENFRSQKIFLHILKFLGFWVNIACYFQKTISYDEELSFTCILLSIISQFKQNQPLHSHVLVQLSYVLPNFSRIQLMILHYSLCPV